MFSKYGWNWPSGSGEQDKSVKSEQIDWQTEGQQTTGNQKNSPELSSQKSNKNQHPSTLIDFNNLMNGFRGNIPVLC